MKYRNDWEERNIRRQERNVAASTDQKVALAVAPLLRRIAELEATVKKAVEKATACAESAVVAQAQEKEAEKQRQIQLENRLESLSTGMAQLLLSSSTRHEYDLTPTRKKYKGNNGHCSTSDNTNGSGSSTSITAASTSATHADASSSSSPMQISGSGINSSGNASTSATTTAAAASSRSGSSSISVAMDISIAASTSASTAGIGCSSSSSSSTMEMGASSTANAKGATLTLKAAGSLFSITTLKQVSIASSIVQYVTSKLWLNINWSGSVKPTLKRDLCRAVHHAISLADERQKRVLRTPRPLAYDYPDESRAWETDLNKIADELSESLTKLVAAKMGAADAAVDEDDADVVEDDVADAAAGAGVKKQRNKPKPKALTSAYAKKLELCEKAKSLNSLSDKSFDWT